MTASVVLPAAISVCLSLAAGSGGALQAHSKRLNNKHNTPAIWYRFMFVPLFTFDRHTPQHIKALWGKIMK